MGPPASHQTAVVLLDACTSVGGRASTPSCSTHPALPSFTLLHRIPLADTLTLMFLNPAICALLGWVLLGERASWRTAAGWVLLAGSLASSTPLHLRLAASTVLMTVLWDAALGCTCKSPQLPVIRLPIKLPALPPSHAVRHRCLASLAGVACVARPPFLFGGGGGGGEAAEGGAGSGRLAGAGMAVLSAFFAAGQMLVWCIALITCEVQAAAGSAGRHVH